MTNYQTLKLTHENNYGNVNLLHRVPYTIQYKTHGMLQIGLSHQDMLKSWNFVVQNDGNIPILAGFTYISFSNPYLRIMF